MRNSSEWVTRNSLVLVVRNSLESGTRNFLEWHSSEWDMRNFFGTAVDIFPGFSRERFLGNSEESQEIFLGITADFPQNCNLGKSRLPIPQLH